MKAVNANDIKKRGLSATCIEDETLVTVRGRPKFVVLSIKKYEALGEAELTLAIAEAQQDYKIGRYVSETVEEHVKRITRKSKHKK